MKLVKIEDVRVGQIWKDSHWNLALVKDVSIKTNMLSLWLENYDIPSTEEKNTSLNFFADNGVEYKLIGKLGITHEIKDNRLVIISRDKFQIDDVVEFKDTTQRKYIILKKGIKIDNLFTDNLCFECFHDIYGGRSLFDFELKKIGIYGVTHEFVNNKEFKE